MVLLGSLSSGFSGARRLKLSITTSTWGSCFLTMVDLATTLMSSWLLLSLLLIAFIRRSFLLILVKLILTLGFSMLWPGLLCVMLPRFGVFIIMMWWKESSDSFLRKCLGSLGAPQIMFSFLNLGRTQFLLLHSNCTGPLCSKPLNYLNADSEELCLKWELLESTSG